jgi:hypothetical protein
MRSLTSLRTEGTSALAGSGGGLLVQLVSGSAAAQSAKVLPDREFKVEVSM